MKIAYITSILLLMVIMLVVGQRAKSKNSRLAKTLINLTYAVAFTVATSVMAIFIPSESVALFMQTLHFASTEWMLLFLLVFLEEYTEKFEGRQPVRIATYVYSTFCTLMLVSNAVFKNVVYCEYKTFGDESYRVFRSLSPWYEFHEYFSYLIAVIALAVVIAETIMAKSYYRIKYFPVVITLVITMGLEGLCSIKDYVLDFALFGYLGIAIFLIYYSIYHVNRHLITQTLSYVATETAGGIVCFDIAGKCNYANDIAFAVYKDVHDLSDFEKKFAAYEYGPDKENNKWTECFEVDGEKLYLEISYKRLEDKKSGYVGCFFYLYDKTEDVVNLEEAIYQATHDTLTGLYNDNGFAKAVAEIQDAMPYDELCIVTMDIKDFKLINDLFGYETGDDVLKSVANTMKRALPYYAACCRKANDHFYFCMRKEDFSEKRVEYIIEKISDLLEEQRYQMVVHFGVYDIKDKDTDVSVMCDCARMAMHRIKSSYDCFVEYFDISMMNDILKIKDMVKKFESALDEGQFKMYLQPQVDCDGKIIGAEALVRWIDPKAGIVCPGEFIPVFEDVGLIYKLDLYIWEQAAKTLKQWQNTDKEKYHISVNISPKDFLCIDIYTELVDLVEKYEIDPKYLKLEITESVFMKEPEKQLALIADLQSYGFDVEIDDFGSGFSSLNILKDMKPNVLKIDMGFLRKTKDAKRSITIIDAVIKMAKLLNMAVISEGVEEKEQVEFLKEAGCDCFQGFYFDRPIPLEEFESKY